LAGWSGEKPAWYAGGRAGAAVFTVDWRATARSVIGAVGAGHLPNRQGIVIDPGQDGSMDLTHTTTRIAIVALAARPDDGTSEPSGRRA